MLRYSKESGRGLIATRHIKTGEMIMEETPAVWVLSWVWPTVVWAVFLSFLQSLSSSLLQVWIWSLFLGKFVSYLMLSADCCSSHPVKECAEMQKLSIKSDSLEYLGKLTLAIVVLRCLLLPETAPQVLHAFINNVKEVNTLQFYAFPE